MLLECCSACDETDRLTDLYHRHLLFIAHVTSVVSRNAIVCSVVFPQLSLTAIRHIGATYWCQVRRAGLDCRVRIRIKKGKSLACDVIL